MTFTSWLMAKAEEGTLSQGNSETVEYPQVFDPARAIEVDPSKLTFGIFPADGKE